MSRGSRHKSRESAYYHLFNRVAGSARYFPFRKRSVARQFLLLWETYLALYFCRLGAFELMGNHYHAIVHFQEFRKLEPGELIARAQLRWGRLWQQKTRHWQQKDWEQFNRDLFDVSRFMQHIDGEFAKWFNRRHGRRGHFWADRFKNPQLLDRESVQECLLYVELNAVRAGLVSSPEQWKLGSAYWRWANKKADWLIPLPELFEAEGCQSVFQTYRALLYHRGAIATGKHTAVIPDWILRRELQRGFAKPGLFRRRLRFFNDGVAIGSAQRLQKLLHEYQQKRGIQKPRAPIPQLRGALFTLRPQRSGAFSPT